MKDLVGGELDLNVSFCGGEHVAEAQIRHAIEQSAKAECIGTRGSLFMEKAGFDAGRKPSGHAGGIEPKVIRTASLQQCGESEACFASGSASGSRKGGGSSFYWLNRHRCGGWLRMLWLSQGHRQARSDHWRATGGSNGGWFGWFCREKIRHGSIQPRRAGFGRLR